MTIVYAHRGAAIEQPENTMPSFRRALELSADALEMDAHLTADGHVVIAHDPTGARLAGVPAEIRKTPLADVRRWDMGRGCQMPTLDEVLADLPAVPLNIDVKQRTPDMTAEIVSVIRRHRAEDRVLLASFHDPVLRRIRALGYRGKTSLGRTESLALLALPAFALRSFAGRAAQLPIRVRGVSLMRRGLVARCRAAGVQIDFWTVNDPADARTLLALGVDGIMTDDPATIVPVVRGERG